MSVSQQPIVSVLVPIYNVQDYLEECLDSLRAQTLSDFEVICINDGSTDNSREIIGRYLKEDTRFRVIDKENSGYGASMNRGLDAAKGTYIAILESDDFCEPNTLERLYNTIEQYDAEVVKANCYLYWSGPPTKNVLLNLVPRSQTKRLINPQENREIFYLTPAIWAALYRRDFLQAHTIRFTETPGASYQDTSFNFKVWASAERAVFLKEAFVHYRQDNQASSVKSVGKAYCVCDESEEMERYLQERPATPDWLHAVRVKLKFNTYLWNYERLDEAFQREFLERFAKEMALEEAQGYIDWQLFETWYAYDLKSILKSPKDYHNKRLAAGKGALGKIRHYAKIGGLPLLAKIAKSKLVNARS